MASGTTVVQGIIIFIIIIVFIVIIVYIIKASRPIPFPLSPFNFGDIIQISPAVLCQNNNATLDTSNNQFLSQTVCNGNNCPPTCYKDNVSTNATYGSQCAVTFTGSQDARSSKWLLTNFFPAVDGSLQGNANQNATYGFGNRFYLINVDSNTSDKKDPTHMMAFWPLNLAEQGTIPEAWNPGVTSPITGAGELGWKGAQLLPETIGGYSTPLLTYFFPTNYPDLYYLLFPANTANALNQITLFFQDGNTGALELRPWAQPNDSNYFPYTNGILNQNSMVIDYVSNDPNFLPPEVFLFKVTLAS